MRGSGTRCRQGLGLSHPDRGAVTPPCGGSRPLEAGAAGVSTGFCATWLCLGRGVCSELLLPLNWVMSFLTVDFSGLWAGLGHQHSVPGVVASPSPR